MTRDPKIISEMLDNNGNIIIESRDYERFKLFVELIPELDLDWDHKSDILNNDVFWRIINRIYKIGRDIDKLGEIITKVEDSIHQGDELGINNPNWELIRQVAAALSYYIKNEQHQRALEAASRDVVVPEHKAVGTLVTSRGTTIPIIDLEDRGTYYMAWVMCKKRVQMATRKGGGIHVSKYAILKSVWPSPGGPKAGEPGARGGVILINNTNIITINKPNVISLVFKGKRIV